MGRWYGSYHFVKAVRDGKASVGGHFSATGVPIALPPTYWYMAARVVHVELIGTVVAT